MENKSVQEQILTDLVKQIPDYCDRLGKESDRGAGIISAAFFEEALEELIKIQLTPSPGKEDELFEGAYAPLNNFSAKIDIAYRLGLILPSTRSSLHLIRKLRNGFAHSALHLSFESPTVKDRIRELFGLNKYLFDVIWKEVKTDNNSNILEMTKNIASKDGIDYLVQISGFRRTFELLVALLAYSLKDRKQSIKPLKTRANNVN